MWYVQIFMSFTQYLHVVYKYSLTKLGYIYEERLPIEKIANCRFYEGHKPFCEDWDTEFTPFCKFSFIYNRNEKFEFT